MKSGFLGLFVWKQRHKCLKFSIIRTFYLVYKEVNDKCCNSCTNSYAKILGEQLFRTWEFPRSGSKAKNEGEEERLNDGENNGQATLGARKHAWRTQAAWANTHGARKHAWRTQAAWAKKKRKRERLNNGENNGQATHGARKHAWRTQGARKPPGPICTFKPHPNNLFPIVLIFSSRKKVWLMVEWTNRKTDK